MYRRDIVGRGSRVHRSFTFSFSVVGALGWQDCFRRGPILSGLLSILAHKNGPAPLGGALARQPEVCLHEGGHSIGPPY